MDIFSRKIVGWQVYDAECSALAGAVMRDICQSATVRTYWPNGVGFEIDRPNGGTSELYWAHRDRLGSVVAISGIDGSVPQQQKLEYDAWGKRRSEVNHFDTPDTLDGKIDDKGYTGHEMLDGVDLVHMNGRVYDPQLARFLSADPYLDADNGQGFNRFSYVLNNPTNLTDSTGFHTETIHPPPGYTPGGMGREGLSEVRSYTEWANRTYQNGTAALRAGQARAAIVSKAAKTVMKRSGARYLVRLGVAQGANVVPGAGQVASGLADLALAGAFVQ